MKIYALLAVLAMTAPSACTYVEYHGEPSEACVQVCGNEDDDCLSRCMAEHVASCTDNDSDCDHLPDDFEVLCNTNPNLADSDGDLINDDDEDSDHDGYSNYSEYTAGTDPADPNSTPDDDVVVLDPAGDEDNDGLSNGEEEVCGTDPLNFDSDGDGHSDAYSDSDGDGLLNSEETEFGTDCSCTDSDADGIGDGTEVSQGTDPNVAEVVEPEPEVDAGNCECEQESDAGTDCDVDSDAGTCNCDSNADVKYDDECSDPEFCYCDNDGCRRHEFDTSCSCSALSVKNTLWTLPLLGLMAFVRRNRRHS